MKIQFTPSGGAPTTLGDDSAKYSVVIEQWGGTAIEQREPLAGGANPALFPRGNVGGDFIFRSAQSYADYETTFSQFATLYGLLNQQGALVVTQDSVTLTMSNAVLKSVTRLFDSGNAGVFMAVRYTFGITTLTTP